MTNIEDYKDILNSCSSVEEIVDATSDAIKERIKADVADMLDDYQTAHSKLYELQCQVKRLRTEKEQLEKEETEFGEEYARKYLDAFAKRYTKGIKPEDTVWFVTYKFDHIPCGVCNGKGRVTVNVGSNTFESARCPACDGAGSKNKKVWYPASAKIKEVRLDAITEMEYGIPRFRPYSNSTLMTMRGDDYISAEYVYTSQSECEAVCKRYNEQETQK